RRRGLCRRAQCRIHSRPLRRGSVHVFRRDHGARLGCGVDPRSAACRALLWTLGRMLKVENLTAGYGGLTVLDDVSLLLPAGARLGIFGHNGAGKTTLLRCIVGAVRPRRGRIDVEGTDTSALTVAENVRRGIAFMPQGHNVFPNLTVEQN